MSIPEPRRPDPGPAGAERNGPSVPWPRAVVAGVRFDALTQEQVVAHVHDEIDAARGGLLLTPTTDVLRQLQEPALQIFARRASLIVPQGRTIAWAGRLGGHPLPGRVEPASLLWALSREAAARGHRVHLLGSGAGVARSAAAMLEAGVPGLGAVGWHQPPPSYDDDDDAYARMVATLRHQRPDIVFVDLGFPRQELLGLRLRSVFPTTWFVSSGSVFAQLADERALSSARMVEVLPFAVRLLLQARRDRLQV